MNNKSKFLKLFSLMFVLVIVVTSFAACGDDKATGGENGSGNDAVNEEKEASGEQQKHIPVEERTEVYMPIKVTETGKSTTVIDLTYDENGKLIKEVVTKEDNSSDKSYVSLCEYSYDEFGNCTRDYTEWSDGDSTERKYSYTYDGNGNILTKTDDTNGDVYTYTYDENGNVLTENADDSYVVSYVYDDAGNILSKKKEFLGYTSVETWEYSYDNNGNKVFRKHTDEEGKIKEATYKYDTAGNLLEERDALIGNRDYEFDKNGNLTREVWYGEADEIMFDTQYTYNDKNELVKTKGLINLDGGHSYEITYTYEYKGNQRIVTEHYTESDGDEQTTVTVGVLTKYPNGIPEKTYNELTLGGSSYLDDYGRN